MNTEYREMENTGHSSINRLGLCQICQKVEAKYTCPACEVVTCSVACVKEHKQINECDGSRSKTAFVRLKQLNDLHLLSDYRLMEEAGRCVDRSKRDLRLRPLAGAHLPYVLQKLKLAVLRRGTRLHFLPKSFKRRDSNTTCWDHKTNIVMWKIQFTFLNANKLTLHMNKCSENTVLGDIIEQYISNSISVPEKARKHLTAYRSAGFDSIDVLMKTEKIVHCQKKFYKLNLKETLKNNFAGKNIVEFPQLYIMVRGFYTETPDSSKDIRKRTKVMNYLADCESLESGSESTEEIIDNNRRTTLIPSYKDLLQN